ncbi:MAG: heme A synthase [Deltaproteobacteria bacterium]|nr:MAG: heme A synthase [Deltaproteobacteria bacterium]
MQTDGTVDGAQAAGRLAIAFSTLALLSFGLIVLGALVRAHGAGLACPDWPLCFGQLVPPLDLKVGFEWTHRLVAGGVSIVFAILAVSSLRQPATGAATRRLLAVAAALLVVQVILGGLTVLRLLAPWTVTSHLLTGNAFAAALLLIALQLREDAAPRARRAASASDRFAVTLPAVLLVLQIGLGGLVSSNYAGLACEQWPTCNDGVFFPSFAGAVGLQLAHRLAAYALLAALVYAALATRRQPELARITGLALALGLLQIGVGVANVLLRTPVEITGLHTGLAAALVLTLSFAVREVVLRERPSHGAPHGALSDARPS